MEKITLEWLEETNEEFKKQGITDGEQKTHSAISKWRKENVPKLLQDKNIDHIILHQYLLKQDAKIEEYFLTQSSKDRGYVEPPFAGIYYFQGHFWIVSIPLVFGRVGINIFECLKMPVKLQNLLVSDDEKTDEYISVFADSYDYAYGIDEVKNVCITNLSKELFKSADKHLRATISLLNQEKASSKAIEDARMSVEIFLKAFLSEKENLTDKDLQKQIGHNLEKAIDRCIAYGLTDLNLVKNKLHIFPEVYSRYEAPERSFGELWTAYRLAHITGTTILRDLTKRDIRTSIMRK